MRDPQKDGDFPEPPYHTDDNKTWFRWMFYCPNLIDATDAAEAAGLLRSLLQFAVGWIGQEIRMDDLEAAAERKAAERAAWREFCNDPVPF